MKIGFWGIGNMGGALMKGYAKTHEAQNIFAFDLDNDKLVDAKNELGVNTCDNIEELALSSDIIVVALKPNLYEKVLPALKPTLKKEHIVVSVAAGISLSYLENTLGGNKKIIRTMPNTPALVNEGMAAISINPNVSDADLTHVMELFESVGKAHIVDEDMMDTIIGISGSSPAYVYIFIEALIKGATEHGMDRKVATTFAAQSVLGAAKMVLETNVDPDTLRDNVCSPGGTTIEAVKTLQENRFEKNILDAMEAAINRSKELAK